MPTEASINSALDRAADVYEDSLMLSTIVVYPPRDEDTEQSFNEATGEWTDTPLTAIYTGKAHIRLGQARPIKTVNLGESLSAIREWRLRVPRGTVTFEAGCVVEVTAADRSPQIVGQRFRVDDWPEGTLSTTPLYMITQYHPRDHRVP